MTDPQALAPGRWTRDYVFDILRHLGIHHIFGVPGTNEIPIIDGCSYPENQVRYIECLHENIAIGAAMGYAHMSGKPGILVVHVTPGIGHSLGNLFNASRSHIPLVILCCQQHNELVTQEPLLASNLVQVASQYTKWAHELRSWEEMPLVLQRAFKEAMAPPMGPVFLSLPWDFTIRAIAPDDKITHVTEIARGFVGDEMAVQRAANILAQAEHPIIIGGDAVGSADAWPELQQLAEVLGAPVLLESFSAMANFPNSDYHWQGELPGGQAQVQQLFKKDGQVLHDVAFFCGFGLQAQVTVFRYADGPLIPPEVRQIYLDNNTWNMGKNYYGEVAILGDIKATLPRLVAKLQPTATAAQRNEQLRQKAQVRAQQWQAYLETAMQQQEVWAVVVAQALQELIVEYGLHKRFVYVHEAVSDPAPFQLYLPFGPESAAPISYYCVGGGALGWSMPATLGIKLQQQGYQGIQADLVINAVGDGSALFYPQVWWTAMHEQLPILYIILNNQEYHTLQLGLRSVVATYGAQPGYGWKPKDNNLDPPYLKIERPFFEFIALAKAFGIQDGVVVRQPQEVKAALRRGVESVLNHKQSFIVDTRTAKETPTPPPAARLTALLERYITQPPLDIFHAAEPGARALMAEGVAGPQALNIPLVL